MNGVGLVVWLASAALVVTCRGPASPAAAQHAVDRIVVDPVFLIPRDAPPPTEAAADLLMRHLRWSQERYRELLGGSCTFVLAGAAPLALRSRHSVAELMATSDGGAEAALLELLAHDGVDRFTCRYVYVVLFAGTGEWPGGGARPINGGLATGGGIAVLSADALLQAPNFQSTLQHELGHAFGLPHVDVYGYDMASSPSLMSYNPAHHTNGLTPSATPGAFIPEDRRALALAWRVLPGLTFDPARDVPAGYALAPIVLLGPMTLSGEADYTGPAIVPAGPVRR